MIKVNSTIKLNMSVIQKLERSSIDALIHTAEALHTEVVQAQVVPRRDGVLQNEAFFVDYGMAQSGKVSLVHSTPYARRLYFHPEYHFHTEPWEETVTNKDGSVSHLTHDGNPNARGKWFRDWEAGGRNEKFVLKIYKKIYRRLTGL